MYLEKLKKQFTGRKFGELVLHHVKSQTYEKVVKALSGTLNELSIDQRQEMMLLIDSVNAYAYDENFWAKDCGEQFESIINLLRDRFNVIGSNPTNDDIFNGFNIIVLNFAYGAHQQKQMKDFIIKSSSRSFFRRLFS